MKLPMMGVINLIHEADEMASLTTIVAWRLFRLAAATG